MIPLFTGSILRKNQSALSVLRAVYLVPLSSAALIPLELTISLASLPALPSLLSTPFLLLFVFDGGCGCHSSLIDSAV